MIYNINVGIGEADDVGLCHSEHRERREVFL